MHSGENIFLLMSMYMDVHVLKAVVTANALYIFVCLQWKIQGFGCNFNYFEYNGPIRVGVKVADENL